MSSHSLVQARVRALKHKHKHNSKPRSIGRNRPPLQLHYFPVTLFTHTDASHVQNKGQVDHVLKLARLGHLHFLLAYAQEHFQEQQRGAAT